jgi:2-aminoethylphosphonate-pyruvate transaminase
MDREITLDKSRLLFTPGPLTTSRCVKEAMLRDMGSRDSDFIDILQDIRYRLLKLAGVSQGTYAAIPMQGSGTFGLESVVSSVIPPDGKILVAVNGAYGRRLLQIAKVLRIKTAVIEYPENRPVVAGDIRKALQEDPDITHVVVCHCETTSGIINPIKNIGKEVKQSGAIFMVDAMSSFGAIPINLEECEIDYLVSSSNKCIEGVPGFSFILANRTCLSKTTGYARSLCLDLLSQYKGLEKNGQFRFTPPTHALLAFHRALIELEEEGGIESRMKRYKKNHHILMAGMTEMGFQTYLDNNHQSCIITSFVYPQHANFNFDQFYAKLREYGFVIYPGKVGKTDCFRIGTIGRIYYFHIQDLLKTIRRVLEEMNVELKK